MDEPGAAGRLDAPTGPARVVHLATTDITLDLLLGAHLRAMLEAGYRVDAISAPGDHAAAIADLGVEHHPVRSLTRAMRPGADVRAIAETAAVIRRLRPDIVHTHNPKPGWFGRPLARLARVPVVVNTVHGLYAQPGDAPTLRAAVRGLERGAAAFSHLEFVQNPEDLETLRRWGVPERRLRLLGNGVDLDRFRSSSAHDAAGRRLRERFGIPPTSTVVLSVGRLVAEKGFPELFDAMRAVRASDPNAVLVVVGPTDADKADGLGRAALRRAAADGVVLPGFYDRPEEWYAAGDVFVLASHREGFPRAAMEASAMGLPVIATRIRGCRQVVVDGVTGSLVPTRDADALAGAILALLRDSARRRRQGDAARHRAMTHFDQRMQIRTILDAYGALLPGSIRSRHRPTGAGA